MNDDTFTLQSFQAMKVWKSIICVVHLCRALFVPKNLSLMRIKLAGRKSIDASLSRYDFSVQLC